MGLCCSKPVIVKPTELPSSAVATQEPVMEQNPMIPHDQHGVPPEDEITIVHVVQPVENVIEVVVADPVEILPMPTPVVETVIIESEPTRDSARLPCQIELYKEAIGVIEKHSREPTVI